MRSGFVLFELLLGMVITALLAAIALPRFAALADSAAVRSETLRVVAALDAARGAAGRLDGVALLAITDTSYRVTVVVNGDTVRAWEGTGPANRGVVLGGTGQPIAFGPDGLAMGVANRTVTITKGSAARRVVMSRLGRLTY